MSPAHRLLVVEGDAVLRDLLVEQLSQAADLEVASGECGAQALALLEEEAFDILLAETALPEADGPPLVASIREAGFRGPIILLASTAEEADHAPDPEAGGVEFVAKPFKFAVLLARIRALLRAREASEEAAVPIGPYTFRAGAKTLTSEASGLLRLTEKEAAILRFLHRAGEAIVSRETLLQEVWGYNSSVTTHTLETHIYRLRQKIETDPSAARILVTEPGGYRLVA